MTTAGWMTRRFLPAALFAAVFAGGLSFVRAWHFFLVGFQGMLAGGVVGWISGCMGRNDPEAYWTFGQRCWLGVSMMIIYSFSGLLVLSILNAGPIDPPLYWLGEVLDGFRQEEFVGTGHVQAYHGEITGAWWVFLNLVDAGLFGFLFIALCRVGLAPDKDENSGTEENEIMGSSLVKPEPGSHAAFHAMFALLGLLLAAVCLNWALERSMETDPAVSSGFMAWEKYEGTWRFAEGKGIFSETESVKSFKVMPLGMNSLALTGLDGGFHLTLNPDGRLFRGLLYRKSKNGRLRMSPVRVRFSPDGKTMIMVVTRYEIGGRRDVVFEAERQE
jgi:hypothetical protein